jgi:hypothetical protein
MIPVQQKKDDEEAEVREQLNTRDAHELVHEIFSFSRSGTKQVLMNKTGTEGKKTENIPAQIIMPSRICKAVPGKQTSCTAAGKQGKFNKESLHGQIVLPVRMDPVLFFFQKIPDEIPKCGKNPEKGKD